MTRDLTHLLAHLDGGLEMLLTPDDRGALYQEVLETGHFCTDGTAHFHLRNS